MGQGIWQYGATYLNKYLSRAAEISLLNTIGWCKCLKKKIALPN